jgi:hypothetical protein
MKNGVPEFATAIAIATALSAGSALAQNEWFGINRHPESPAFGLGVTKPNFAPCAIPGALGSQAGVLGGPSGLLAGGFKDCGVK